MDLAVEQSPQRRWPVYRLLPDSRVVNVAEVGASNGTIKEKRPPGRYAKQMSLKTSTGPRRAPASRRKKAGPIEIVVRRGALKRFDALKTKTGELPVVVTWDRRTDDRRDGGGTAKASRDRRDDDRRRTPPFTWDLADFVVVEPAKDDKTTPGTTPRKRKKPAKKS